MALYESYLRIRLSDPEGADAFQTYVQGLSGYIGSYTVDVKPLGSSTVWTFHLAAGYRQEPADLDATVATIRDREEVEEVRELRNQQPYKGGDEQGQGVSG